MGISHLRFPGMNEFKLLHACLFCFHEPIHSSDQLPRFCTRFLLIALLTNHLLWLKFPSVLPFFRPLGVGLSFGRRLLLPILASGCLTLCLLIPADMYHVPKHRAIYAGLPSPQLLPVVLLHVTLHPTAGGPAAHTNCAAPASECPQAVIEMVSASPGWPSSSRLLWCFDPNRASEYP